MATYTTNYNLIKPDYTDPVDVKDLNDNSDIIDAALAAKANLVGGKVPASELPSYVDDVVEGYYYNGAFYQDSAHTTAISGETGKIYIDLDSETCYRWTGSVYVKISSASDALYVEFTESSGVYSCDTGLADMYDALDEGREVIGVYDNSGVQEKYYVGNYSESGDYVTFYSYNSTGKIAELFGTGSGSETWSYDEFSLTGGGGGQLPTATNLGDIPSWNPGTQLWGITHKGSIAQSNQGWVTGGDVYTAIGNIPQIPVGTNTGDILVWDGYDWVSKPKWQMIYQPCEWIRSSGVCYFNTGYYPQTNDVFTIDYQLDSWANSSSHPQLALFGAQNGGTGSRPQVSVFGENNIIRFSCQAFYDTSLAFDTNRHTIVLDSKNGEFKYDGNTLVTFSDDLQTPSYEMRILSSNQGGGLPNQNNCLQGFYYGLKVENGGTIIRNYIPVYIIYTGEVGIFDTANLVFYSKSGSGTLTHGADVN